MLPQYGHEQRHLHLHVALGVTPQAHQFLEPSIPSSLLARTVANTTGQIQWALSPIQTYSTVSSFLSFPWVQPCPQFPSITPKGLSGGMLKPGSSDPKFFTAFSLLGLFFTLPRDYFHLEPFRFAPSPAGLLVERWNRNEEFNRAKLLNIGFAEALKEYDYDCFVFSDVDLIPMDDRNTYKCYSQPRHLSVSMDKFGFRLPYNQYFGGVSALSKEQFTKINGFPNNYWGWGGEDDDIYNRLVFKGMGISRPDAVIGKCRMIRHSRDRKNEPNPERFDRIAHTRETMSSDGLNTLSYKVLRTDKYPLYTKITVDVGSPKS
uniref:Beta-1,4-galactosyltransferase n=1 Tax=Calidris pygmaea TaxID=425635 RepID=A0A8C3JPM6_9CHAR